MVNFNRSMLLLAATSALVAGPAFAATTPPPSFTPIGANPAAKASARIVKPLTLKANASLDFATIVLDTSKLTAADTVSLDTSNKLTCGTSTNLTCSGSTTVANFTVTGTKGQIVQVLTDVSDLTGSNGGKLVFTPAAASTADLSTAGTASFDVGGSITVAPTTADGVYSGDMNVTVDYQ